MNSAMADDPEVRCRYVHALAGEAVRRSSSAPTALDFGVAGDMPADNKVRTFMAGEGIRTLDLCLRRGRN